MAYRDDVMRGLLTWQWSTFLNWSSEEWFNLSKHLNCVYFVGVSGHLPVPELIIKGGEGLNLANFEELFIGTVNWQKHKFVPVK